MHWSNPDVVLAPQAEIGAMALTPDDSVATNSEGADRSGRWWDLDLQFGYGRWNTESTWLIGVRGGVTWIRGPWFLTIGGVLAWPLPDQPAVGVQAEIMNLSAGLWLQSGVLVGMDGHIDAGLTTGFSLIGVEARLQHLEMGDPDMAVLGRLRIPIGMFALAAHER